MTDYRFPTPGTDARFPGGGVDAFFPAPGTDARFVGGQDLRFDDPGFGAAAFPATQTVSFGDMTRRGHGGHALGYPGVGTLSISAGNGSGFWAIDAQNHLVIAGTYGAAPPALAVGDGAYVLTVTDGTVSSVVTINVVANRWDVRPLVSGPNADTASVFQLRTVLNAGSSVRYGDEIVIRDGTVYNADASLDQRIRKGTQFTQRSGGPVAPGSRTDPGWVRVRPETPGGATIRRLTVEGNTVAAQYIFFDGIVFERFNTTGGTGAAVMPLQTATTAGQQFSWIRFENCIVRSRIEGGATIATDTNIATGLSFNMRLATAGQITQTDLNGNTNIYVHNNTFRDLYDGVSISGSVCEVVGNTFTNVWNDCIKGSYSNSKINWNVMVNKNYGDGALHGDFIQTIQNQFVPGTYVGNEYIGNVMSRGMGRDTFPDGQGVFIAGDTDTGIFFTGVTIRGNIYVGTFANGIVVENSPNAVIEWNTIVYDRGTHGATPAATGVFFSSGRDGGTARFNAVTNASTTFLGTVTGAPAISPPTVTTPNVVGLDTDAEYSAAFAAPAYGASANTLAEVLTAFSMKSGGSLDMATTGFAAHCGAAGTGYVDYVNRTTSFPAV